MTEVLEAPDLESAQDMLRRTYGNLRISARDQRGWVRLELVPLGPVTLHRGTLAMHYDADAPPLGALVVGWLTAGVVRYCSDGSDRPQRPGDVFLLAQPDHSYKASIRDAEAELTFMDPALPGQIADTEPGRTPRPVRFTGYEPVSAQAAESWKRAYLFVRDNVLAVPGTAGQPLIVANAARLLAATALYTLPNTALTDPTSQDRNDGHPDTLRRAIAFIDEHAHQDITPADIAAAAFVTIRAVQLAFRRHLDSTPMEYLRRVRLSHAHRQLITADPARETVTAVAYRWGFSSPSRFAAYYRQAYGIAPSQTLRQD